MQLVSENVVSKWKPMLDIAECAPIRDPARRKIVAQLMENTERELQTAARIGSAFNFMTEAAIPANIMGGSSSTHGDGAIDIFDPVMMSLLRRSMPNLLAYDIGGVQPMTGPTGLVFAMRARYSNQAGTEAFYGEANTAQSGQVKNATTSNTLGGNQYGQIPGDGTSLINLASNGIYNYVQGMNTAQMEALGSDNNAAFSEMAFSIEKVTVTARGRALAAGYTMELAQDLKAVHGEDAENILSNILSTELLAEINREFVRLINITAKPGAQTNTTTAGIFDLDTDSNGRWMVEKFKGLMFALERECNQIAIQTRRGKGNLMICSSDTASALQMAGVLDYTPALNSNNLQVDDTGNTFVGVLNGKIRVYIDPYAIGGQYVTVGYRGASPFDSGIFYCPYVPLQMVRAVDPASFQPRIGFKTRYGIVANPFAQGDGTTPTAGLGALTKDSNAYYRRVWIANLM